MTTTGQDQARALAERIARRIAQNTGQGERTHGAQDERPLNDELAAVRQSLEELQQRLSHIESHITDEADVRSNREVASGRGERKEERRVSTTSSTGPPRAASSPWLSGIYVPATTEAAAAHPSQERFGIEEAAVTELVDYFEREKTCSLEPGEKPCDHCAMCSTRGF